MFNKPVAVIILVAILVFSGCGTETKTTVYNDPLHASAANVELDVSQVESYPGTLAPREITFTEIDSALLKETLQGDVTVTTVDTNTEDDGTPYYKTVLQASDGAYWIAMDGTIHMYTYMLNEGATIAASIETAAAVEPEAVEQDITAAESLMEQLGMEQMVLYRSTTQGDTTGLYYRYADLDNVSMLDNSCCEVGTLLFEFSYAAAVVENGIVQSLSVFRPYEITGALNSETIITPEEAANCLLNAADNSRQTDERITLNEAYLAWATYGTVSDGGSQQSTLRPYWVFANADHPEWTIAVDAITGDMS